MALDITLRMEAVGDAVTKIDKAAKAAQKLADQQRKAADAVSAAQERAAQKSADTQMAQMRRVADAMQKAKAAAQLADERAGMRAEQQLQREMERSKRVVARASAQRAAQVTRDQEKAEAAAMRAADAPTLGQRLSSAALTSRFGMSGGGIQAMPLVNRVLSVLDALPGPIATAAKIILALGIAATEAAKHLTELANAGAQAGGTPGQIGLFRSLGMDVGSIPGLAGGLRNRMATDPLAAMAGSRLGVSALPQHLGGQNNLKVLTAVIDGLEKVTNAEERLRLERMLGYEELEKLFVISRTQRGFARQDMRTQEQIRKLNPKMDEGAADFMASLSRIGEALMTVIGVLASPVMKILTPFFNMLATALNSVAAALSVILAPINFFLDALKSISDFLTGGPLGHLTGMDSNNGAMDANTKATMENTRWLKEGITGGGPAARGAMPSALRGEALNKALDGRALTLGAFAM